jgi:hypothetical protein
VTTVLLTAIVLVAVMFIVVVASLALATNAYHRRRLDDARAQARHWVERLGGELYVLDGAAAVGPARVGPAGLAEAAERFAAANAELGAATSPRQCRIAQGTAGEGLHHIRTARRSLGLDPGPWIPGLGVGAAVRGALTDGTSALPRLVDAVLTDSRERAARMP